MAESTTWQFRSTVRRKVYTGLSRSRIARALQTGRIQPNDLVLPPGATNWVTVESALAAADAPAASAPPAAPPRTRGAAAYAVGSGRIANEGRFVQSNDVDESDMDMTPMIDVVFQLLIFFMLTSAFLTQTNVDLPDSVTGVGEIVEERVSVDLVPNPKTDIGADFYFAKIEDGATATSELTATIRKRLEKAMFRELVIRGARDAPIGAVRAALHAGTEAGAEKILVAVDEMRK